LDIFETRQRIAHDHGFATTIQMTYASLFNEKAVQIAKEHHQRYGDEINDLHNLFAAISALAVIQDAFPEFIRTEKPLRLVLDRRPFL